MDALKQVLQDHAARYPLMEPTDAVKLIYQNEFGGGHLIRDEESCLAYLQREYVATAQSGCAALTEDIGNGFVRIHLSALDSHGYPISRLGEDFIRSASHTGAVDSFLAKLDVLRQLTHEGRMPFPSDSLQAYLNDYAAAGYPMVSHSEAYRNTYHPAYRIVKKSLIHRKFTAKL